MSSFPHISNLRDHWSYVSHEYRSPLLLHVPCGRRGKRSSHSCVVVSRGQGRNVAREAEGRNRRRRDGKKESMTAQHDYAGHQTFTDFLQFTDEEGESEGQKNISAEEKAQELIDRTSSLLKAAEEALKDVRQREPTDSRHRRHGTDVIVKPPSFIALGGTSSIAPSVARHSPSQPSSSSSSRIRSDARIDSNDGRHRDVNGGESINATGRGPARTSHVSGLDSWFQGKIDPGPMKIAEKPRVAAIATMEKPLESRSSSLKLAWQDDLQDMNSDRSHPEESHLGIPFETDVFEEIESGADARLEVGEEIDVGRRSGEEVGPDGYWYRWTEVEGKDESGAVQWYEKWWEISDWKGMRELGAEKWGFNAKGDAWRETWRESIGFDQVSRQPTIERSAHKWAKSVANEDLKEWEEKWAESYWSGGRAEKWADKWGKDGGDCWHEKWGESYDGHGGCVKWTDRWAERPAEDSSSGSGAALNKWGDKWEERFKDGKGSKQGETWYEDANGQRYQRWWGENHFGDGLVHKFGHSTEGEHWDTTEQQDTYYNPIPHFGYDLALRHSPQLRNVPVLARDSELDLTIKDAGRIKNAVQDLFGDDDDV